MERKPRENGEFRKNYGVEDDSDKKPQREAASTAENRGKNGTSGGAAEKLRCKRRSGQKPRKKCGNKSEKTKIRRREIRKTLRYKNSDTR